jgi:predicted nuclease of predicted toxin-antitoxin system
VAKAQGFSIITMDEDFQNIAARYGTPPQVVWVRLGNVRRVALIEAFAAVLPEVLAGLEGGVAVIEVG